jgi:hypothetical protein
MNILTDILSLFKRKQIIEEATSDDLIVVGRHEKPDMLGIASPIPYKSVKLIKVKDLLTSNDCSYNNVTNNTGTNPIGVFYNKTSDPCSVNLRSLSGVGNNISVVRNDKEIEISTTGEPNTAINLGAGTNIYKDKVGEALRFKSLVSTNDSLTLTETDTEINLTVSAAPSGVSGSVQFTDGTNFDSDAANFFWDDIQKRLGLGTNTPLGILHLKSTSATTRMLMDGDAGQSKIITYRTAGLQRFGLYTNNTAESGANAGSDFAIRAYADAGTLLSTPVFIKRSTGNVGINTLTGTAKLQVVGSGTTSATTSLLVQNSASTNLLAVLDNGNVGFGTTTPQQSIETIGSIRLSGSGPQTLEFSNASLGQFRAIFGGFSFRSSTGARFSNADGSPDASAFLEVQSTTKGFLPPRMTTTQRNAISLPAAGLMVYDTDANKLFVFTTTWEVITST